MDTKEFRITVPDGYEIDKENSTFECVKFKRKKLTYEDVVDSVFKEGYALIDTFWQIKEYNERIFSCNKIIGTSRKHIEKIVAINKILIVAKYLNKGWKPSWSDTSERKWFIGINEYNKIDIRYYISLCDMQIYFRDEDLAKQAVEILGEEAVRLALSTDW